MNESLSEAATILSGAPLEPEVETPDKLANLAEQVETPEPAIGDPGTPQMPVADSEPQETEKPSMTVKTLAEKLEIRPQDLYKQLMIDVGSGETLSLSEVKDAGAKLHKAETILADAETHRQDAENELLRKQHAMQQRAPTEAELADGDASWKAYVSVENGKTLAVISAWSDPAQQRVDLTAMSELLGKYQFSPAEIARYADHRMVKQLYDHMILRARLTAATDSEVTKTSAPVGKAKRKSVTKPGAAAVEQFKAGKLSHSEAVAALIAEG